MERIAIIALLMFGLNTSAQTPYDSFAPETSRPMLGILGQELLTDSILCAVVADMQNQILLLVDVSNGEVIATAPLTDDVRKWLSVDPLADKYPNISPYAYCAWNPVGFVDPDGRFPLDSPLLRYLTLAMTMENSHGNPWSTGCQTGGNYKGAWNDYNAFMKNVPSTFNGWYYLRTK